MPNTKFKLAMGQILVQYVQVEENLERAEQMIQVSREQGCSIIVLPECLDIGWANSQAHELAESVPGRSSDRLCEAAKKSGIYVVAGLTERAGERIYNTAVLISPGGDILQKHRKINVLAIVQDIYSTGDRLWVTETELGKIGINICADNFPNNLALAHSQARMGADILLSPCAWAVKRNHDNEKDPYGGMWEESYTTLARLYDITVVGVSYVGWIGGGPWKGDKCIGCSLAVGPGGKILAKGPYGVDSQKLIVMPIEIIPRQVTGDAISEMLKAKGYEGC